MSWEWSRSRRPRSRVRHPSSLVSVVPMLFTAAFVAAAADGQEATHSGSITVTASRRSERLADTPASVVIVDREALDTAAAPTLDDALRQVPGFALFRRNGSRTANPTAQGVSLRGIGASGASRALVLDDGVPIGDAFGGWVYWGRVPRLAVERVELLRGGASELYGSGAFGGVIQFVRRQDAGVSAEAGWGSQSTASGSLFAASSVGEVHGSLAVEHLATAGWIPTVEESRGPVDRRADTTHTLVEGTVRWRTLFVRGASFGEGRNNGTPLQVNETDLLHLVAGSGNAVLGGHLTARLWGSRQDYRQTFSAVAADRTSERLTVDQRVPSRSAGASVQIVRAFGGSHVLSAGADLGQVTGASEETQFTTAGTSLAASGGRQRTAALFVQHSVRAGDRITLSLGLRADAWRNLDGSRNGVALASRRERAVSPRLSALVRLGESAAATAAVYGAFRAPTLNELYRGFRVGNAVTNANELLGAERLRGAEIGVRSGAVRVNAFAMAVEDVIANVTIASTPSLITRQRRNAGRSQTVGLEIDAERRVASVTLSAGYLFAAARVSGGSLDGKRLPQVPRHQASLLATRRGARGAVSLQARWGSSQFEDDLNRFLLRGWTAVDAFVQAPLGRDAALVVAAENVFDRRIESGATPVRTVGQPRAFRLAIRYVRPRL